MLQDGKFRAILYVTSLNFFTRRFELLVLSIFILEVTNSPLQLALVWVFQNLPRPLVSPLSGVIADRFSRHRILVVAQSLNASIATSVLLLLVSGLVQPWHIFAAAFLQGVTQSLEDPSRRMAILDIVGQGRLVNAMSMELMGQLSGKMTGPIIGGILIALFTFKAAYGFVLVVHLISLGLLLGLVRIPRYSGTITVESIWRGLGLGVRYALHNRMVFGVLYITIIMNALAFPVQQFIPIIGRDLLGVGPALVGLLVAADGFGMLVSAVILASSRNLRYHGRLFVVGTLTMLATVSLFVWSPWYALSFAFLTIGGIGQAGFGTMQSSITMLSTPQEMRGRMLGLLSFCISVGVPLGTLEIGLVAVAFSTQWAISVNVLAGLLLILPSLMLTPLIWQPSSEPLPQRS